MGRLVRRLKQELELKLQELLLNRELLQSKLLDRRLLQSKLLDRGLLQNKLPDKGLLQNKLQEKELLPPLQQQQLLLSQQLDLFTTLSTRLLIMMLRPIYPRLRLEMEKP